MLEQFLDALNEGNHYQFLCDDGMDLTKDELVLILKEFICAIKLHGSLDGEDIIDAVREGLEDYLL